MNFTTGTPSSRRRRGVLSGRACATPLFRRTSRCWTMRPIGPSTRCPSTAPGARRTCRAGSRMGARFDYAQAEEIRDVFARHGVRYLFLGKSGAILLGFPDTTQDADVFVERSPANGKLAASALRDLGFTLSADLASQIERGKDFVQIKEGPFDIDLIFAPDGI